VNTVNREISAELLDTARGFVVVVVVTIRCTYFLISFRYFLQLKSELWSE